MGRYVAESLTMIAGCFGHVGLCELHTLIHIVIDSAAYLLTICFFMAATMYSIEMLLNVMNLPKIMKKLIQQDCVNNMPTDAYNHEDTCKQSMPSRQCAYTFTTYFPAITYNDNYEIIHRAYIPTKIPKVLIMLSTSANNIENNINLPKETTFCLTKCLTTCSAFRCLKHHQVTS